MPELASLNDIVDYLADADSALRFYYSTLYPYFVTRFAGYLPREVAAELAVRIDETEMRSVLVILARVEAAFRRDYDVRCTSKKADPISIDFRKLHKKKGKKVRFEDEILDTWRRHLEPADRDIISQLRTMLKYRHWLAHGRYWNVGRTHRFQDVYLLADVILSDLPLQG